MTSPKTEKPARDVSAEPVSIVEQLGSGLDQANTPNASTSQARRPSRPDDRGEDDETFFRRRPNVLPFPNEFPDEAMLVLGIFTALVRVVVERDQITHEPRTLARSVRFVEGGHA